MAGNKKSEFSPMDNRFQFAIETGKRLKKLRTEAGVSLKEMSDALGYKDYTAMYHLESGRNALPSWAIPAVCALLKCSPGELLGMNPTSLGSAPFKVGTGGKVHDEEMVKADRESNRLIGERLRAIRQTKGLTLAEVAEATGLNMSAVSRAETSQRRISASQIAPLAQALGVTVGQILGTEKM